MKNIIYIFLFFAIPSSAMAQTFSLKFQEVLNNGTDYRMEVYISFSNVGKLGSSNFQFTFDDDLLEEPTLVSHQLSTSHYEVSITEPDTGKASLNVVLNSDANGNSITSSPNWFKLATINFKFKNSGQLSFNWLYKGGSSETVAFIDDNITQIYINSASDLQDFQSSAVLPVELCCLDAIPFKNNVLISWKTLSEQNNSHFNIQRSDNGIDFNMIGKIDGQGTSSQEHPYQFLDETPYNGINYYRLQQVDFNGDYEYSSIVKSEIEQTTSSTIKIYPNPVTDEFQIDFGDYSTPQSLQIRNSQGIVVKNLEPTSNTISVSDLSSGLYFLVVDERIYLKWVKL